MGIKIGNVIETKVRCDDETRGYRTCTFYRFQSMACLPLKVVRQEVFEIVIAEQIVEE